jgi:glycosyltransferase involved in cell wall biosynthesis
VFKAQGIGHIHAPWADGPATAAWAASYFSGIPFSFSARARDLHPPDGALLEKMAAAKLVRTNTLANRDYLAGLAPQCAHKLVNVYNGVSLAAPARRELAAGPPHRLLAIGRLVPKKGFATLVEAVRLLVQQGQDIDLTIAGDGPERRRLAELVQRCGLGGRVSLPGFAPHAQVPGLLAAAHLLVMPSQIAPSGDRDGIPNVILEALAAETPVVATPVAGIPEVIRPGDTGWLAPPENPQAIAAAIAAALADPDAARRLARRGQALVRREFDSRENYGRLKRCFHQAMGRGGSL